jgi:hypothetical protein
MHGHSGTSGFILFKYGMVTIHIGKGKDDLWRRHICSINEAPTVPPSLLFDYRRKGLNNYQIQKSNMNLILNLSIKKKF